MTDAKPVDIISDAPVEKSPMFGFDAYAKTVAGLIANKENETPLAIGIYGPWGSGKTTLMKTVKQMLDDGKISGSGTNRVCKTVWFQAWKYNEEDAILAALIEEIFKTMAAGDFFEKARGDIEKITKRLNKSQIIGAFSKLLTGIDVSDFFSELEYKDKLGFYDVFQKFFDDLLWTYLNWHQKGSNLKPTDDKKGALVIFIDDLDRCPEDKIVRVLETIKLFMDKQGCIFVIGAANDIIKKALKKKYADDDASKFMDKIVQVTFNLPQIPEPDFQAYIEKISPELSKEIAPHLPSILTAIQHNPRRLKRFLNNIHLLSGILSNKDIQIGFSSLLTLSIIEYVYPHLWNDIKDNPQILSMLKQNILDVARELKDGTLGEVTDDVMEKVQVPRSLQGYIQQSELVDIVKSFTGKDEDIRQLITLTGIVERDREPKVANIEKVRVGHDEMVEVPAGKFLYGEDKKPRIIEKPFLIDVYPVTNAQYENFIKEDGYKNEAYWVEEGFEWKKKKNINEPRLWQDKKWNQPKQPVVGVSFFEADAYARWAKKALPTGEQWERAARGTDGREYPWGDGFDKEKCNTKESGIGRTTRVTRYPNGTSPMGCYDMAGNVWEWAVEDNGTFSLRGGSWGNHRYYARCANRFRNFPYIRYDIIGFRCVRT